MLYMLDRMSVAAGAVSQWLHNAARYPLLTAAQEVTLGNQIRAWLDADNPDAKTIRRGQRATHSNDSMQPQADYSSCQEIHDTDTNQSIRIA